jgi:hypothetical protein
MDIGGLGKEGINLFLFLVNCGYLRSCGIFSCYSVATFKSCGYYGDYHKKVLLHHWLLQGIVATQRLHQGVVVANSGGY